MMHESEHIRRARDAVRKQAASNNGKHAREDDAKDQSKEKQADTPTVAEQLVRLAQSKYRFGRTDKDEVFAVALDGANLAIMFKGSKNALRARLAKLYREKTHRTPGASALADAMNVLEGEALAAEAEQVQLRVAAHENGMVIDLGTVDGQAVIVRPGKWELVERSPELFRRTALTGALPIPMRGGKLTELRDVLNVTDESWPLIVGYLIAALVPSIPHAVLLLSGLHGTGKTCCAKLVGSLFDPSSAEVRSEPRNLDDWQVAASGSWLVVLDNISYLPNWLSDAICKASTGDGLVKRALFTDGEIAVLAFRRVVVLTSIDAGALRGDLGDRLLLIDLEPIPEEARKTEEEIKAAFAAIRPRVFGALLDALALVLAKLPETRPARLPRMADFARVLAAADAAGVTSGAFERFQSQRGRIAADVIDGDPFGLAVVEFVRARGNWTGTATDLLAKLPPGVNGKPPHGFPKPSGVKGHLKRLAPSLKESGVTVAWDREPTSRRRRMIHLALGNPAENSVQTVQSGSSAQSANSAEPAPDNSDDSDNAPRPLSAADDDWGAL